MEWFKSSLKWLIANMGLKAVAVVIAIILWIVVLASKTEIVSKEIPIQLSTPEDLVPSNEIPKHVSVQLSGPKAFLRAVLNRKEPPIQINLANRKAGYVTYRFFPDNVSLPLGISVVSFNPSSVVVQLEKMAKKTIPVRLQLQGIPPEGFQVTRSELSPSSVTVSGARSKINRITEVQTYPIDVSDIESRYSEEVKLAFPFEGLKVETTLPTASIEVAAVVANFKIRNIPVSVLSQRKFKVVKARNVTVFIRANPEQLRDLDQSKVLAQVDMGNLKPGTYDRPVQVVVPKGIGIVKVVPEKLKVTLY